MMTKVKNIDPWTYVISDIKSEECWNVWWKIIKENPIQIEFDKAINYMSNGNATIIILTVGLIKKT